jgi:hypothetical protein
VRYQNEQSARKRRVEADGAAWVSEGAAWTLGLAAVSWESVLFAEEKREWRWEAIVGDGRKLESMVSRRGLSIIQPGVCLPLTEPDLSRPADMIRRSRCGVDLRCGLADKAFDRIKYRYIHQTTPASIAHRVAQASLRRQHESVSPARAPRSNQTGCRRQAVLLMWGGPASP